MKHGDITYVNFDIVMVLGKKYNNIDALINSLVCDADVTEIATIDTYLKLYRQKSKETSASTNIAELRYMTMMILAKMARAKLAFLHTDENISEDATMWSVVYADAKVKSPNEDLPIVSIDHTKLVNLTEFAVKFYKEMSKYKELIKKDLTALFKKYNSPIPAYIITRLSTMLDNDKYN